MTQEELLSVAEVIERLVKRFEEQGAEYERKMAEHRDSFVARTEADSNIIEGLRAQVHDQRAEIERLRIDERKAYQDGDALRVERDALKAQASRYKLGYEEGELRPASPTPKQHPVKVGEWVERTKLPSAQSPIGIVKQVTAINCDGERYHFADGDFWSVDNCEPCAHQHPAQDGQWVRRTVASGTEPVGTMIRVQRSRTLHSEYVTRGAQVVPWAHCEPCDPPADHDTPAGKEAAEAVIRDFGIKVGDVVEVFQATGSYTNEEDIGARGVVTTVCDNDKTCQMRPVENYKKVEYGWASLCDVRKVTQ